jgi:hypothetical protein
VSALRRELNIDGKMHVRHIAHLVDDQEPLYQFNKRMTSQGYHSVTTNYWNRPLNLISKWVNK